MLKYISSNPSFFTREGERPSESIDDIWLLLLPGRFVKYSNKGARVPLEHELLRSDIKSYDFLAGQLFVYSQLIIYFYSFFDILQFKAGRYEFFMFL